MTEKSMTTRMWDKIGICASGLCLLHCLITPIVLILFPASQLSFFADEWVHKAFGVLVTLSILAAVYPHCKKHGHKEILTLAIIGVILILTPIFFHDINIHLSHISTVAGSIVLIIAHIKNMKVRHGKCEETEGSCSGH